MKGNHRDNYHPGNPSQQEPVQEDLLSTAVRYVLEEMTGDERAEFECRLVERQDAREAVAEAVALCQSAKRAIDTVMRDAAMPKVESAASRRSAEGVSPLQSVAQDERVWRAPATWVAMAVAASIVLAVVMTGVGGVNPFGHKLTNGVSPGDVSVDRRSPASESLASAQADRSKQLAVAWLSFLPSPNEAALLADVTDAATADGEDDADDGSAEDASLAGDELDGEGDVVALVDSTGASDWVFQAITAEPPSAAIANPQEG